MRNMTLIFKVVMVVVVIQAFTAVIVFVGLIVAVVGDFKIIAPKNIIIIPIKIMDSDHWKGHEIMQPKIPKISFYLYKL